MRAVSLVAWPLQTAFARNACLVMTARGSGFHALSGLSDFHHLRQQHRAMKQRQYDGLWDRNKKGPRRLIVRCLNRIMLEPSEVVRGEDGSLSATLDAADSRAAHVRSVLKAEDGQTVRVGVVDAGLIDDASITWRAPIDPPDGAPPPDIPGRKMNRKSASKWKDLVLDLGGSDAILERVPQERRPKVALMLALPRPLQLERILPMISSLGVTTLVLCTASKVEKMYFGSHLFRDPHSMRERLVEGLSQCGNTVLPEVFVARRLKVFLEDDLERLFPEDRWVRTVAHPTRLSAHVECAGPTVGAAAMATDGEVQRVETTLDAGQDGVVRGLVDNTEMLEPGLRFAEVEPPKGCHPSDAGVLVAVGPEGGWVEPNELDLLQSFGFQAVTLGSRVLRSDVAVCALLALAHAWVEERVVGVGSTPSHSVATPPTPVQ